MSNYSDTRVSARYAGALFRSAVKLTVVDAVSADLATLTSIWSTHPQLRVILESPLVTPDRKLALLEKVFSAGFHPVTSAFLKLLVTKRREGILLGVSLQFVNMADQAAGRLRASAIVARPMDHDQRVALVSALESRTGKSVVLEEAVVPTILGGVIVRLQDTVIDGSVLGSLERLRLEMLQ